MKLGRFGLERLRLPGVSSLPVWNRPLADGRQLWQRVGVSWVGEQRRQGVAEGRIGHALASTLVAALDDLQRERRLSACFLTGGLCGIDGFREALLRAPTPCPVHVSSDPVWAAAAAGLAWLVDRGVAGAGVLDVGQTSIKTLSRTARSIHERDPRKLPFRFIGADGSSRGAPTEPLAAYLSEALAALEVPAEARDPRLLLALPCPIEQDLLPGPCTYGWQGDAALLPALFGSPLGPWPGRDVRVQVLNDAELAAEAARRALEPPAGSRVLCLTLGFGPGGALLET